MADSSSPIPLYHQVRVVLRQKIADGAFESGLLPSEKQLEAEFGVSRVSVRKAVDLLSAEGLVTRMPGRGTRITGRVSGMRHITTSIGPFENLVNMGYSTDVKLLEFAYVPAPSNVARELDLAPGFAVQRAIRVRSYRQIPFSYLTTWIPQDIGQKFSEDDLRSRPILQILEGIAGRLERASQLFSAEGADPSAAKALQVPVATPLLSITRVVRTDEGRAVEMLRALYRPDRYQYVNTLMRNSHDDGPVWLTESEGRA